MGHRTVIFGLMFLVLTASLNSYSQVVRVQDKCFKVELIGSMVNVQQCKSTQLLVKNIDCKSGQQTGANQKLSADLKKCTSKSAEGFFMSGKNQVFFKASLRDNPEFEVWDISAANTNPNLVTPSAKTKKAVVEPIQEDEETFKTRFDFDVEADWVIGLSPNKEPIIDSAATPGGYYGRSTNAAISSQVYQNQIGFNYLILETSQSVNELMDVNFSLAAGQKIPYWFSSPFGLDRVNTLEIADAFVSYRTSETEYLTVGLWSAEILSQFTSAFLSHTASETILTPHIYSGLSWWQETDNSDAQVFIANGWNELQDINNSFAIGAKLNRQWSEKWQTSGFIYTGDEGAKGIGTEARKLIHIDLKIKYNKQVGVGLITGKWGSDFTYNSFFMEGYFPTTEKEQVSVRYEYFSNEKSFLLKNGWSQFYNVTLAYRRDILEHSVFKTEVNYSNSLATEEGLAKDKPKNRFYLLSSVTIQF